MVRLTLELGDQPGSTSSHRPRRILDIADLLHAHAPATGGEGDGYSAAAPSTPSQRTGTSKPHDALHVWS